MVKGSFLKIDDLNGLACSNHVSGTKIFNRDKNMNNQLRLNDLNDLEKITLKQVEHQPNFFYHPEFKEMAVNIQGDVLLLNTNKIYRANLHKHKTRLYVVVTIDGKTKSLIAARLIARVFVGRPSRHLDKSFKDLHVNHVDGDKTNNKPENLEWVTCKENNFHAHYCCLYPQDSQVSAINVITGEIKNFHSAKYCADNFNIHRATLFKHLNSIHAGKTRK